MSLFFKDAKTSMNPSFDSKLLSDFSRSEKLLTASRDPESFGNQQTAKMFPC